MGSGLSITNFIPGDFWKHLPQHLPSDAGGRILTIGHIDGIIDPGNGSLVLFGLLAAVLVPAVLVLKDSGTLDQSSSAEAQQTPAKDWLVRSYVGLLAGFRCVPG